MGTDSLKERSDLNGGFILVAEDHPPTVELFILMLRADGIENEVVVAGDGAEALDYLFGTGEYQDASRRRSGSSTTHPC
jgi:hypothetical protein